MLSLAKAIALVCEEEKKKKKKCPKKILSASSWFVCLGGVAVTGVERETDTAKDRRREDDAEAADS